MNAFSQELVLLVAGWSSGISIYLTIALLGICGSFRWIDLPGNDKIFTNPIIIAAAVVIYAVEFLADKIPFIDSAWDSVHTFIRPAGAMSIGFLAGSEHGVVIQTLLAMMTGTIALNTHATKAATRLVVNTSPEPFSNIATSFAEHSAVIFVFWFFIKHPFLAAALVIAVILISFFILRMLWRFVRMLFSGKKTAKQIRAEVTPAAEV